MLFALVGKKPNPSPNLPMEEVKAPSPLHKPVPNQSLKDLIEPPSGPPAIEHSSLDRPIK